MNDTMDTTEKVKDISLEDLHELLNIREAEDYQQFLEAHF